ncbi:hypothetical protein P7C73_g6781, partial [Tremellales sp. Uapishka_1]
MEKEIVVVVEVDVEDDAVAEKEKNDSGGEMKIDDADFGWGFDEDEESKSKDKGGEVDTQDDGWGFDDSTSKAGPSKSDDLANAASPEGDGWDFEDVSMTSTAPPPPIVKPAKPAREAKRLGKKVAKVKHDIDEDVWGSGSESQVPKETPKDQWGGWEEPKEEVAKPALSPKRLKTKVLKEEKRTVKERYLVSRACDKLLDIAERVLKESRDLGTMVPPSPSFHSTPSILHASAVDIFDIYRSLLPVLFASQIRDVPTISMQLYNDSQYLASKLDADLEGVATRLIANGDHYFEAQLDIQRESLEGILGEANGFEGVGEDVVFRRCEKVVKGLLHSLESLARVLKAVLPTSTYLSVTGYLLDYSVSRIATDILALDDITEIESNRLNELCKLLHPLESLFILQPEQVSSFFPIPYRDTKLTDKRLPSPSPQQPSSIVAQVPHWLRFCYISELLQANLVDITYLLETGALVDFTTTELVSVVRALFADSPKRDATIEKIEGAAAAA